MTGVLPRLWMSLDDRQGEPHITAGIGRFGGIQHPVKMVRHPGSVPLTTARR